MVSRSNNSEIGAMSYTLRRNWVAVALTVVAVVVVRSKNQHRLFRSGSGHRLGCGSAGVVVCIQKYSMRPGLHTMVRCAYIYTPEYMFFFVREWQSPRPLAGVAITHPFSSSSYQATFPSFFANYLSNCPTCRRSHIFY